MDAWMAMSLRLVQAMAAGEDQIRATKELLLIVEELPRRKGERGELIHAIEDRSDRLEMPAERHGHRRVVPEGVVIDLPGTDQLIKEPTLLVDDFVSLKAIRQPGHHDREAVRPGADLEPRGAVVEHGLFDEEDSSCLRTTAQEMLRPLVDEVPTEMR